METYLKKQITQEYEVSRRDREYQTQEKENAPGLVCTRRHWRWKSSVRNIDVFNAVKTVHRHRRGREKRREEKRGNARREERKCEKRRELN